MRTLSGSPSVSEEDGVSTRLVDVEDEHISSPIQSKPQYIPPVFSKLSLVHVEGTNGNEDCRVLHIRKVRKSSNVSTFMSSKIEEEIEDEARSDIKYKIHAKALEECNVDSNYQSGNTSATQEEPDDEGSTLSSKEDLQFKPVRLPQATKEIPNSKSREVSCS